MARYGDAALVNFYQGFHQAGRMNRHRLKRESRP
jgi:hypothetical protein